MIIPSFKLSVSYKELNMTFTEVLFGSAFDEVDLFERSFAQYLGVKYAIGMPSARWGLYHILKGLNLKEGDEVILPAFTYFAVPAAIVKAGLKPVFVDISSENLNISARDIIKNITQRTRAIIPTHLCGFACGMNEILDIAGKYNIFVIEDCAQSLGAEYKNNKLGSLGCAAYFTFGITKHFTTLDGGMVVTNDKKLADSIRSSVKAAYPVRKKDLFLKLLKGYVMKLSTSPILFRCVYYTMRMFLFFGIDIIKSIFHEKNLLIGDLSVYGQLSGAQARLGLAQLSGLDKENTARIGAGSMMYALLSGSNKIMIPLLEKDARNIFSSCPVLIKDKYKIRKKLLEKGIDVSTGYLQDCSRLVMFKEFRRDCPNASRVEKEVIYLPVYPGLKSSATAYIAKMIKDF